MILISRQKSGSSILPGSPDNVLKSSGGGSNGDRLSELPSEGSWEMGGERLLNLMGANSGGCG
jgi:hypothetical protein